MALTAIDLFAGAGGASLGLQRAGLRLVGAAEWSEPACETHRRALPDCPVFAGDVREYDPPAADLWWSSPPCQAWSSAGTRKGAADERNGFPWLIDAFDRASVRPRWLLIENVVGLTHHRSSGHGDPMRCPGCYLQSVILPQLRERFDHVSSRVIDCADLGLPQRRKRLIIACGPAAMRWPVPTHADPSQTFLLALGRLPWVSMGAALGVSAGVPFVMHACRNTDRNPTQERHRPSSEPAPTIGGKGNQVLSLLRPSYPVSATEYKGATPKRNNRASDSLAQATDRRRLTVAECAALQGFPVGFAEQMSGTLQERYRQIGNAVPPVLAESLARCVLGIAEAGEVGEGEASADCECAED